MLDAKLSKLRSYGKMIDVEILEEYGNYGLLFCDFPKEIGPLVASGISTFPIVKQNAEAHRKGRSGHHDKDQAPARIP